MHKPATQEAVTSLHDLSAADLIAGYRAKQFSPSEVFEEVLAHIAVWEPHLKALYAFDPEGARKAAEAGQLAFGTIDSFLLWRLTGGAVHATDATNAARTSLFDIHCGAWDRRLAASTAPNRCTGPRTYSAIHHSGADQAAAPRVPRAGGIRRARQHRSRRAHRPASRRSWRPARGRVRR